jgi:peptidoglycan/xylan/chitin deacetylase (PgdA/CDA1 family)
MEKQSKQRRPRRSFSEEFKEQTVRLVLDEGKPTAAASIGHTTHWKWDVDSEDWKTPGQTGVILQKVEDGLRSCPNQTCQMLFHDRGSTVRSLQTIIPTLKDGGLQICRLSVAAGRESYWSSPPSWVSARPVARLRGASLLTFYGSTA